MSAKFVLNYKSFKIIKQQTLSKYSFILVLILAGEVVFILPSMDIFFLLAVFITAQGIYAARVFYFTVLEEGNVPLALTGTAVGVILFWLYTQYFCGIYDGLFTR